MQAVVLLNAAEPLLQPLEVSALLPIGQQALIEITLGWLESNGLNEVYLVTCSHADQLGAYLRQAGWAGSGARRGGMAVHVVAAPGCTSEGEALRFMEQKDVIEEDFLLVSGSVLGNLDLRPAMQAHQARRATDRQALMTLLLHCDSGSGAASSSSSTQRQDRCLAVVDPSTHQLLKLEAGPRAGHAAGLATHVFGECDVVTVRSDLRLAHVYLCAPEVLVLLSDNFDYQSLAGDLVPGVLAEQELGSTMHIHELSRGYVERVRSPAGYAAVVEDVVSRWAYPWVPDNSGDTKDSCRFNRGSYVDASAVVASGAYVSKGSLIGCGSSVDTGARLERSIVGSGCHVGRGSVLQASCLHSQVRVDDGCRLSSAVLAEQSVVRSHARVEMGVLLGKHTVVDAAQRVPAGMRVSLAQQRSSSCAGSDEDGEEWEEADASQTAAAQAAAVALAAGGIPESSLGFDEDVVGPFGAGFALTERAAAEQEALATLADYHAGESDCDSEAGDFTKDAPAVEEAGAEEAAAQAADQFKREVAETFLRCIHECISHENAVIELNGLKIAEDRTFGDCARYIFTTMLSLCLPPSPSVRPEYRGLFADAALDAASKAGRLELLKSINGQLREWKELLRRFLKSSDDQVELLLTFEEYCAEEGDFAGGDERGAVFAALFPQVVKLCYDQDLLSEESILDWAREKESAGAEDRRFVDMCSDLVVWLEDADEESSEEEEEEESGSEEEEDGSK